ncbi:hypothetical protein M431DRAFT_503255 [Trichoderma harzianum CBS 226.95]|uniref:Uncharacterized protein n=1 Tax=Trichoderma harzianum CBS 226.95 TaxID=983964 RepID=A0A2T4AVK6_TRIHA|nr:hypothetical protein M431DRAFT_503255 [Trichoderma harzianum CBS 226.95]PTB61103.1 hypothetical protein M431DRAFT_503255 [Trichoderma harzianum CBS 226.95]
MAQAQGGQADFGRGDSTAFFLYGMGCEWMRVFCVCYTWHVGTYGMKRKVQVT